MLRWEGREGGAQGCRMPSASHCMDQTGQSPAGAPCHVAHVPAVDALPEADAVVPQLCVRDGRHEDGRGGREHAPARAEEPAHGEWEGRRLRREARRGGAACAPVAHGEDAPEHTLVQQRVAHPLRDNHIDAAAAAWASSSSSSGGRPRSSRDGPRDVGRLRLAAQAVDAARHAVRSDDEACVLDDLWGGGEKGGGEDEGGAGAKGDERALRKPSVRRTMEASSATTARAPAVAAKRDRMPVPHPTSRATRPGPLPPPPNHDGLRSMASR